MQKQKGFTLMELIFTIVIVGMMASVSAPSFQQWQRDLAFTEDTETFFDTLADARAAAVSERKCEDDFAIEWNLAVSELGVELSCVKELDGSSYVVRSREWASPAEIKFAHNTDVTNQANWFELATGETLKITIYPGGTQALIADTYSAKYARVFIKFEDLGKEKTICYSRIANYPYYSKDGTCNDES